MGMATIIGLAGLLGAPALAPATVNSYTPAQADRARQAVRKAGYTPDAIAAVQDENFFLNARRAGQTYQVTVTRSGKVYASTGIAAGA